MMGTRVTRKKTPGFHDVENYLGPNFDTEMNTSTPVTTIRPLWPPVASYWACGGGALQSGRAFSMQRLPEDSGPGRPE